MNPDPIIPDPIDSGSTGSDPASSDPASSNWHDVARAEDLAAGDVTEVVAGRTRLVIYDCEVGLFATRARCSHHGAALVDGYLNELTIECPLHQGCFDVRDGRALAAPATKPIATYRVRIDERGVVQVQLGRRRKSSLEK